MKKNFFFEKTRNTLRLYIFIKKINMQFIIVILVFCICDNIIIKHYFCFIKIKIYHEKYILANSKKYFILYL
jgi:hypothetical protein